MDVVLGASSRQVIGDFLKSVVVATMGPVNLVNRRLDKPWIVMLWGLHLTAMDARQI